MGGRVPSGATKTRFEPLVFADIAYEVVDLKASLAYFSG